ncbi:MAG: 3'-5' exonuclease [Elusimicrobiota bacterium]|jgi:DNA polymerase III epsilon subunit family exonuclease|nr:3'-5' exonuclease [Elusimicrobiota bacterium]
MIMENIKRFIDPLKPPTLVYLDIETTGLYANSGDKIIEIAMLKIDGKTEEKYEQLINPCCLIPPEGSKIHRIYDDMLKGAPCFKDIAQAVLNFIEDNIVVCHNASFDLSFIVKELQDNSFACVKFPYIDTLTLARKYFNFQSNSLGGIAKAVGIDVGVSHRAMADVLTMYQVSKYLFFNIWRKGFDEIEVGIF